MRARKFVMLILLICFALVITTVYASSDSDSVTMTEQELAYYQIDSDHDLSRVYQIDFIYAFAEGKSIKEIISEAETEYYISNKGFFDCHRIYAYDDGTVRIKNNGPGVTRSRTLEYAWNPNRVFLDWVQIRNTYVLCSNNESQGGCVYFVTSIGDFVLHQSAVDAIPYLFPVDVFVENSEEFSAYMKDVYSNGGLGYPLMMDVCDIESYRFTGPETVFQGIFRTTGIILSISGWALAVLFFLKWRKTKKQSAPTPEPDTPAA